MSQTWKTTFIIASALAVSIVGIFIWKKKKRSYVKVGHISKLFFFPVKSLKATEVSKGKCTKLGFEVNGVLDRSFTLINAETVLVSQIKAPRLVLLTPRISGKTLFILSPNGEELKVEIKDSVTPEDKLIVCSVGDDKINAVDCGDEAAAFFQKFLHLPDVRLVRFFPSLSERKTMDKHLYYRKVKKENPVAFQNLSAVHIVSQASIDDVNSKIEQKISVLNFRPNILISGCKAFEEDSWKFIKFSSGVELKNVLTSARCLSITNDPDTGELSEKEPLETLRKYRMHKDPDYLKKTKSRPCVGIHNAVLNPGEVSIGDEIFSVVGPQPVMLNKMK